MFFMKKNLKKIFFMCFGVFQYSLMQNGANFVLVFENGLQNSSHFKTA